MELKKYGEFIERLEKVGEEKQDEFEEEEGGEGAEEEQGEFEEMDARVQDKG